MAEITEEKPETSHSGIADPYEYSIRVGDGWTLSDGTFDRVRASRKRKRDVPRPYFVDYAFRSMSALSSLQLSRDAPITMATIDVTTNELWNYLPPQVKDIVVVPSPVGPELWGDSDDQHAEAYERMKNEPLAHNKQGEYKFYAQLKGKPWVFWPIWVEDQWGKDFVVVAWYANSKPESPDRYDQIGSYVIYDPRRDPKPDKNGKHGQNTARLNRINNRLIQFFDAGKFNIDDAEGFYGHCSPMGLNETSSGERCFATIKELLNYLINSVIDEFEVPDKPEWPLLSRWVFPYLQRIEMTGIVAWTLMASHQFNARIAIECLEPDLGWEVVVDGERRMFRPIDLSGPAHPTIADADYLLDPNAV